MSGPQAALLPGDRLHLHHGPIDLILSAEGAPGARQAAFAAAQARFATVLAELAAELPLLRAPVGEGATLTGHIAQRMAAACAPHLPQFITPMAAVAGAVADAVLVEMTDAADLNRAVVNNGGDIAAHLTGDATLAIAIAPPEGGVPLGTVALDAASSLRGLATSGQGGRSHSLGIADAVTVLAPNAAMADAAATLIGNAVDLPGHPNIRRVPARELAPDSDLGARQVVTAVGALSAPDAARALARGGAAAEKMRTSGLIGASALFLRGESRVVGPMPVSVPYTQKHDQRSLIHA